MGLAWVGRLVCGGGGGCHSKRCILSQIAVLCALHGQSSLCLSCSHMRSAGLQSRRPWSASHGMRACPPAPTVPSSAVVRARSRGCPLPPSTPHITAAPEVSWALCTDRFWSRYRGQPQRIDRGGACMIVNVARHPFRGLIMCTCLSHAAMVGGTARPPKAAGTGSGEPSCAAHLHTPLWSPRPTQWMW
jgi:hypothetical protein